MHFHHFPGAPLFCCHRKNTILPMWAVLSSICITHKVVAPITSSLELVTSRNDIFGVCVCVQLVKLFSTAKAAQAYHMAFYPALTHGMKRVAKKGTSVSYKVHNYHSLETVQKCELWRLRETSIHKMSKL